MYKRQTRTDLCGFRRELVDPLVVCWELGSISVVGSLMLYLGSLCDARVEDKRSPATSVHARGKYLEPLDLGESADLKCQSGPDASIEAGPGTG